LQRREPSWSPAVLVTVQEGGVVAAFKAECRAHIGQPLLQAFEAVRAAEISHGELEHSQLRSRY
ncbi:hypothetical protein HaLaN_29680, partial [Haematococcus lacustris]